MKPKKIIKTGAAFALAAAMLLSGPSGLLGGVVIV